jgi:hypothetical protein
MPENRPLRGDDVIHMSLASPTGAASPFDTQVTLGEIAAYVQAQMPPPATSPTLDEITTHVLSKVPAAPVVPSMDEIAAHVVANMPPAPAAPTETMAYTDGTTATGPGPLPDTSPAQQNAAEPTEPVTPAAGP